MRILFHMCCAPCSTYPVKVLREEGHELYGLFFNPNIHPYTEYKQRLDTVKEYCEKVNMPLIVIDEYNIESFLRNCAYRENVRCQMCYSMRLERAASVAQKGKFDAFTTSLLVSPFQKHEMIKKFGEAVGQKQGIEFLYRDFRPGFKEGREIAAQMGLYRQQYCGCIYSEAERYLPKKKKNRGGLGEH